ncbi:MAG: hypothetical protein IIB44_00270 [Candidatus Marinimicrobia bacterium]|nr:hypothetical protein [Candidatus Neomarinimicrobiota bacterium]MCH8067684.1 hypothetical protein [Candidatus Neomarinimicrobiota bacterium]
MEQQKKRVNKWWIRDLLELGILVGIIMLIVVIYTPRVIWDEEDAIQDDSHFRMENIYEVLSYYNRIVGENADDGLWAMNVVNAARDSLTADSTYLGKQKIYLHDKVVEVDIFRNFDVVYDTSFGFIKSRKDTLIDTVFTVLTQNVEQNTVDTTFVRLNMVGPFLNDSLFISIYDTVISSHVEVISYYDSYMPDSSMFYCPLTNKLYEIDVEDGDLKVESPIKDSYVDRRYLIFSFRSNSHGSITNGEKSWARF